MARTPPRLVDLSKRRPSARLPGSGRRMRTSMLASRFAQTSSPPGGGRPLRAMKWLCAGLGLTLVVLALVATPPVRAAESGVGVAAGEVHAQDLQALGTHWVRMFAPWPTLEAGPGAYDQGWFTLYEQTLRQLPAGSKVILDVVSSPP